MRNWEFSSGMSLNGKQFSVDCITYDERVLLIQFLDCEEYGLTPQDREDIGNAAYKVLIERISKNASIGDSEKV